MSAPVSRRQQWLPAAEVGHEPARLGPDTTGLAGELRTALAETTEDADHDGMPGVKAIKI
jgi:hypothetical protein